MNKEMISGLNELNLEEIYEFGGFILIFKAVLGVNCELFTKDV
jgi:hypothetical protein